jgi:hypothetical protein
MSKKIFKPVSSGGIVQLIGLCGFGVALLTGYCSSSNVVVGKIVFYGLSLSDVITDAEIINGGTTEIKAWNADGYGRTTCSVRIENPEILRANFESQQLRLEALSSGTTRVEVECSGDRAGEQALCDAPFRNVGSINVTVRKP